MEEKIKMLKQAQEVIDEARKLGYGSSIESILSTVEKLNVLGLTWGDKLPRCSDFQIIKGKYYIANSATHYVPDGDTYYIHWDNGNIGRYQFVGSGMEYDAVGEEWQEFKDVLMSYNPVDYDPHNCHMVFAVEDGKRLIADYADICKATMDKMWKKIARAELARVEAEYERLKGEINAGE